ncbi:FtsX-like permease family protein [Candidatus Poriferisodalis sp.]|uniref:FtsX-like permease family protein n=1 Tax=Candidatus Poriferisodalis sp. TaxID=3101277 RepID=UPI003B015284
MWLLKLRWSFRDARKHWVQILGIAFTVSIGVGAYAALSSVSDWRRTAIVDSFELTAMYDLRATVSGGEDVPSGSLAQMAEGIDGIDQYGERLVVDTQVETTAGGEELLVHGRIVGVDMAGGGPSVNRVEVIEGDDLQQISVGTPAVLLERNFAVIHDLPATGQLTVGGDVIVDYRGHAVSPEYFFVLEGNGSLGRSNFAALFTPLAAAQEITGQTGVVNDLVLTLHADADPDAVAEQLVDAARSQHGVLLEMLSRDETPSYIGLTNVPDIDQDIYDIITLLLLGGATIAAVNFSARMVQTQRREIGASMAIGEPPRSIAVRPMLIGLQIGVLGAVLGIGVGLASAYPTVETLKQITALPVFETPFNAVLYARAAAVGIIVPMVAVFLPVVRAVRVRPIEAIRSGHLASRGGGLSPIISRVPLPGRSLERMPFRNLMRAPRRTFLTLLTFTMGFAILFSQVGFSSSFEGTFSDGNQELLGGEPDRFMVQFDSFYPVDSSQVRGVLDDATVQSGETALRLGTSVAAVAPDNGVDEQTRLDLVVRFVDFGSNVWTPTATDGALSPGVPGIVLADKAARDFGVGVGDDVVVTHPELVDGVLAFNTHALQVVAIHPHPLRVNAYMDVSSAADWGFGGLANIVTGVPAEARSLNDVKRSLFGTGAGVVLVQGLGESFQSVEDSLEQSAGLFNVGRIFIILLIMLIAFNTTNLNVDERRRDHATIFAYGLPVRRVIANLSIEGVLLGVIAAVLGGVFGYGLLQGILLVLMPSVIPDVGLLVSVRWGEMVAHFVVALVAVAIVPVFSRRKLKNMFIPGTLRVME